MSSNVALLHSNNCCVLESAICEDLDLHVIIFLYFVIDNHCKNQTEFSGLLVKCKILLMFPQGASA